MGGLCLPSQGFPSGNISKLIIILLKKKKLIPNHFILRNKEVETVCEK